MMPAISNGENMRASDYSIARVGKKKVVLDRRAERMLPSNYNYLFLPSYWFGRKENNGSYPLPIKFGTLVADCVAN